ncbi:hypothetical protein ABZ400_31230 [Streptomyces sp. NPDC005897]|uniref:hypothetical protein n=1 Tax=Streptomyces sp. NPDC005897 TaxID=3157081 RepID=UPI0033D8FF4F
MIAGHRAGYSATAVAPARDAAVAPTDVRRNNSCGATAQAHGKVVDSIARLEVLRGRRRRWPRA